MSARGWCALLVTAGLLLATEVPAAEEEFGAGAKMRVQSLDGPSSTSAGPSNQSKVTAQAATDESKAATQIAHIWPIQSKNGALTGSLMAAAPFTDSNAPKPELGSVSNLTAGTNARLDAGWLFLPKMSTQAEADAYKKSFDRICDDFLAGALDDPAYYRHLMDEHKKADPYVPFPLGNPGCLALTQGSTLSDVVQELNAEVRSRNKTHAEGVPAERLLALKQNWQSGGQDAAQKFAALNKVQPSALQGVSVSLLGNQHSYSYVTTAAPSKVIKQSTEGYGIGVNYIAILQKMSLIAGFSYERPFKGGQGSQVCTPIGTSTSTTCSTAAVGASVRTTARIFSGEVRLLVNPDFALGPRVEYDTASSNFGVKLPIYFVPDAKKTLTGGLQVGWTRQARYQGAVMIQKAFSFWQ